MITSSLFQVLSTQGIKGLPAAYRDASSHLPPDHLSTMLRLCLTDANFPAFVGQVEKELEKLKKWGERTWDGFADAYFSTCVSQVVR